MSNIVDNKKLKNKFSTDLYILSISVNGTVSGSFKLEGFGLPNFRDSWDSFIEGYVKRIYGRDFIEEARSNTEEVDIPDNTSIQAGFETVVDGNVIRAYYTPFLSIGI